MATGSIKQGSNYYETGSYSFITIPAYGCLTGGNKFIEIYIPMSKQISNGLTFAITSIKPSLRLPSGGYIGTQGYDYASGNDGAGHTVTMVSRVCDSGTIFISLENTVSWYATNNIPLSGTVDVAFTLS